MYHGVSDETWGIESLFIKVKDFEDQMKYLHDNGFTPIFLSEIENASLYDKPIVLTFDDGYIDLYKNAFPILKKYNIKSNIFIITDTVNGDKYLSEDMIKTMYNSKIVEFGSHTKNHLLLANETEEKQLIQLKESKEFLEKLIYTNITTLAYPGGSFNDTTLKLVKKFYNIAVTVNSDYNYKDINKNDIYKLNRINIDRATSLLYYKEIVNGYY